MIKKSTSRVLLGVIGVTGFIVLTVGFMALLFLGGKVGLPEGELGKQIIGMLGMIVGTWNSAFLSIILFYYGSSQGSADKNEVIKDLIIPWEGGPSDPPIPGPLPRDIAHTK